MLHTFLFYLFATVLLVSGMATISSRNPVHAVLFLVLSFFNAAGLFLLLGAEFIAFILMIVYVGAVAVLFLFVVMMLDFDVQKLRSGFRQYMITGGIVAAVFLVELATTVYAWTFSPEMMTYTKALGDTNTENTRALGRLLYTDYFFAFQVSGLILFVAMIGAIVLTHRERKDTRHQKLSQQLNRPRSEIIEIIKVESGKGVL